jgi:uncharacterized C2H2 Zn-finger protein
MIKKINCERCEKTFKSEGCLQSHVRLEHAYLDDKKFNCEKYWKTFKTEKDLNLHINHKHIKNKEVKCEDCHRMVELGVYTLYECRDTSEWVYCK